MQFFRDTQDATDCLPPDEGSEQIIKFPWRRETLSTRFLGIDEDVKPGEYVVQTLCMEFCVVTECKIEQVLSESMERSLAKSLQRGEDPQFDQLLTSLGCVAEQSLPSLLCTFIKWYERQSLTDDGLFVDLRHRHKSKGEKDILCERRDLAVEFVYCLVLIEILSKLSYHPGHDDLVSYIISQAFRHFKFRDGLQGNQNAVNINLIADMYAEVIGVLAQSRFHPVRKVFLNELKELKLRDQTPYTAQSIISLLMGLKFFRVKMHPIEDFEACVQFLHELGHYFLEVKDRDIRHALAGLFVEILLPVAANAKNEVNVPVLKNFVEMMYSITTDMTTKKKHTLHLFPLVTCLLCVSQKQFFLNNWPYFLTMCLSQLKNKDTKMSRVALESLYRLLWVYMVRIKCESNTATQSRLQSIVNSLFPKGSKMVTPRDMPLNIFVKIIQFIAKERLDFAMKEIIFDLLCVGRPIKFLTPERMSIGLRAFLVIADSLQQKDGDPPMPQSAATLPSGSTVRVKRTFLNKMLSEATAKGIGLNCYYPHILKTFDSILRALDLQVGRALLLTKSENVNKEADEMITGDRKPKIDLFRTCIAAIPRLLPDSMSSHELVELLTRLTMHMDDELKALAFQAMQNLMQESSSWKEQVIRGFVQFIQKDVTDTSPQLLDNVLRMLVQLMVQWKSTPQSAAQLTVGYKEKTEGSDAADCTTSGKMSEIVLHDVEGLALVLLCSIRVVTRKLALLLLREVRNIFSNHSSQDVQFCGPCLIDVMDKACPSVVQQMLPFLPASEKTLVITSNNIDLAWVLDRAATMWASGGQDNSQGMQQFSVNMSFSQPDPWIRCLSALVSPEVAFAQCPHAISYAWSTIYIRLQALFPLVDPSTQTSDNRASSILRPGSKKVTSDCDLYMHLWHNYVVLACCIAQQGPALPHRCASPELSSSPESSGSDKSENKQNGSSGTASNLFRLLVPLMKCDNTDMRDAVVNGLGHINPAVFKELLEELLPFLKEAIDKKADNIKRRRKRDVLRAQLARIFEMMAENKTFTGSNSSMISQEKLYIDGARMYLEGENERDLPSLREIRLHFCGFVRQLICNTPLDTRRLLISRELRYSLFHLLANWSGQFSHTIGQLDRGLSKEECCSELELAAVGAMSAVLCCGPVFDSSGLNDDGYIYNWLDTLLSCHDARIKDQIYKLAKETVVLLLDFNSEVVGLLEWVVDRCYTGAIEVADGCLDALAAVFCTREYPCDHVAMLNLAVLNVGSPRIQTHETALQLLQLLDTRFFQEEPVFTDNSEESQHHKAPLNDILLAISYSQSQMVLSEQLVRLHPDLTMPMFSEITHRFQTARPAIRQMLLKYLLPWLHNMELVDPSLPPTNPLSSFLTRLQDSQSDIFKPALKGEGWGSPQATEMVLNNLFYVTVKFGDDHPSEIEALWAALVICWTNNLRVIVRYLVIMTNMAASELLPYAKRVITYLGRAKPEKLVDELMNELQTVETLNVTIERTQTPPFYRLSPLKRLPSNANTTDDEKLGHPVTDTPLEKGMLHTKRHSTNEEITNESTPRTDSTTSLQSVSSTSSAGSSRDQTEEEGSIPSRSGENRQPESPLPYPLPMPAYGGYFAPMSELLPDNFLPTPGFHRSNLSVMFLSDLVLDGLDIDWSPHLPLMLHIIFLGLDHNRTLVYEHCKKLLLNLLLLVVAHEHPSIARQLLNHRNNLATTLKLLSTDKEAGEGQSKTEDGHPKLTCSGNSSTTTICEVVDDVDQMETVEQVVKTMLSTMDEKVGKPLWSYEDITPKTLVTQSASLLEYFLKCTVRVFKDLAPLALVEQRWSQIALQLALSCSSRHYAGRSFQVLRALKVRPSTQMLSDILSRLVETIAEQGEDMQGYVTEIMLTLEASIDNLDLEFRSVDVMRELFMSTPNLAKDTSVEARKGALVTSRQSPAHARSTSYSVSVVTSRIAMCTSAVDPRLRTTSDCENRRSNLARSRSAQSLKNLDQASTEDKLTIITQMFWIAISLLESDYEYEFQLAIRLLDKILKHLQPERSECREKLDKILQQIKWSNFPGVQTLLLKGCTSHCLAEPTWLLLSQLTLCISAPVMDPSGALGFPMNVIALLPYLVHHYENPSQMCREAADCISQMCGQQSERLCNLATVMSLYSRGTFSKDSLQWTKCVVKYLLDVYACTSLSMITFLVEVLEKGPANFQPDVLQILYCMTHYVDITSKKVLNQQLFCPVAKHAWGTQWKAALKILKLAVTRSSTLAAAPPKLPNSASSDISALSTHISFAEAGIMFKKELPGRTLDFTVDLSKTAIIGQKYLTVDLVPSHMEGKPAILLGLTRKHSTNQDVDSPWKKPHGSQARTRERLVNLLTCFGQRVGLPKSPSVIFSQSSDTLDHQHSVTSSGEEASIPDLSSNDALLSDANGNDLLMTFKGFDFLDNELEEAEQNDDFFSLGDRRRSLNLDSSDSASRTHFGSVPDLKLLDNIGDLKAVTTNDSISVKEEATSDEESQNSGAEDDGMPHQYLPMPGTIILQNSVLERKRSSPMTASSHSLHSEPDLVDLTSSTSASLNSCHLGSVYLGVQCDEVDEIWKLHISNVLGESSTRHACCTCQIFPRLYKEHRRRLAILTKEACYYIAKTESLKDLASQVLQIIEMIVLQVECPFVFIEPDTLLGGRFIDRHKFCILEIQECLETYSMKKNQTEQCLDRIKCSIKQESLGDNTSSTASICGEDQKGELCRLLYKLIFQLLMLFENFSKLIEIFQGIPITNQVVNMSSQVSVMKRELTATLAEMNNGQMSPLHLDPKVELKQEAILSLCEYLQGQDFHKALQLLRLFRSQWPNDIFGMSAEDDVMVLLSLFCNCRSEKTGMFVLTKPDTDLSPLYSQMMELNSKLNSRWPQLLCQSHKTEVVIKSSDSSTL